MMTTLLFFQIVCYYFKEFCIAVPAKETASSIPFCVMENCRVSA